MCKLDIKRCGPGPRDTSSILKAEAGKFDFKVRDPSILFIRLPFAQPFKMALMR